MQGRELCSVSGSTQSHQALDARTVEIQSAGFFLILGPQIGGISR